MWTLWVHYDLVKLLSASWGEAAVYGRRNMFVCSVTEPTEEFICDQTAAQDTWCEIHKVTLFLNETQQWGKADSYGDTDKCWCSVWQWQMLMSVVRAAVCSVQLCLHSEPGSVLCCCSVSVHGADWEDGSTHWTPVWCCCFNRNWTLLENFVFADLQHLIEPWRHYYYYFLKYHCDHQKTHIKKVNLAEDV